MTPEVIDKPGITFYVCAACGKRWSYHAVRHVARCLACGSGLLRDEDSPAPG